MGVLMGKNAEPKSATGNMVVERFQSLEGARSLLAWWVVFSHLLLRSGVPRDELIWPLDVVRAGGYAVDVFMMLSGFVITHLLSVSKERYSVFLIRRFLRLWPALTASIAFGFGISWLFSIRVFRFDQEHFWTYLLSHLTLLHGVIPNEIAANAASAFIGPAWSISLEWQFYLVAPLVIAALRHKPQWILAILATFAIFVNFKNAVTFGDNTWIFSHGAFLPINFHFFVFGIGTYLFLKKFQDRLTTSFVLVLAAALLVMKMNYPLAVWVLIMGSLRSDQLGRFFSWRPFIFLGKISYSTYLVHIVIIRALEIGIGLEKYGRGWDLFWFLSATAIPATLAMSLIMFYCIERPAVKLGSALKKRFS